MTNNGWIKLHRDIMNKGYYKKPDHIRVWIHILLKANHKEKEIWFNGKNTTIKRGQFITGRKVLSKELSISESKIERILNYLEKIEQQIEQQKTNKNRLISVVNYDRYQQSEQQIEQQVNNKRTTTEQQVNTNKKEKNIKNDKNDKNIYTETSNYIFKVLRIKLGIKQLKELEELLKDIPVDDFKEMIDRAKIYWSNKKSRFFVLAKRWSNFIKNMSIFESDKALNERIEQEKNWYLKEVQKAINDPGRVDEDFNLSGSMKERNDKAIKELLAAGGK